LVAIVFVNGKQQIRVRIPVSLSVLGWPSIFHHQASKGQVRRKDPYTRTYVQTPRCLRYEEDTFLGHEWKGKARWRGNYGVHVQMRIIRSD